MTTPQPAAQMPRAIRLIHAAFITGVVLFMLVAHFGLLPARAGAGAEPMAPALVNGLLAFAIVGFALSLVLRRQVPTRLPGETDDAFWMRASGKAIVTWAPIEFGSLLATVAYSQSGSPLALAVAVVGVVTMGAITPGSLERR